MDSLIVSFLFCIVALSILGLMKVSSDLINLVRQLTGIDLEFEMPDQQEEDYSFDENELTEDVPSSAINPAVLEREASYDEKIEAMKLELELERNKRMAGVIYNEDHDVVDRQYIPKPEYEVAD